MDEDSVQPEGRMGQGLEWWVWKRNLRVRLFIDYVISVTKVWPEKPVNSHIFIFIFRRLQVRSYQGFLTKRVEVEEILENFN